MRDHRFGALTLLSHAGVHDDRALGIEFDRRTIHRRDARAADAVKSGGGIRHFDEARKTNAAINAFFAQFPLFRTQARIVHHRVEMRERLVVREQLELQARGRLGRVGIVSDEIAPAQLERVHADLGSG